MKHIYVIILFVLAYSFFGCRSSKLDSHIESKATQQRDSVAVKASVTTTTQQATATTEKATQEVVFGKITTTTFDPATGAISSIQETRRKTGRNELSNSSERSTDVSLSQKNDSMLVQTQTTAEIKTDINKTTDSRPVQGVEWIYIIISIGIILGILILLIVRYLRCR